MTTKTTKTMTTITEAREHLANLQREEGLIPRWLDEAVTIGDGEEVLRIRNRREDIPNLILAARVTVLRLEIEQAEAEMPGMETEKAAAFTELAAADAAAKTATEALRLCRNKAWDARDELTDTQRRVQEKKRELAGVTSTLLRDPGPVVHASFLLNNR